ncbi:neutral protease NprB [Bacillus subtilis]|uniref:neutral protease NprB n=1 Tax=Bacillus subtilis TaxID=1423 RepID=UPI0004A585F2|nr:neutral protease NprB [Bacillus subtilis]CCU57575.1 Zinc metalloproteinase precursor / aureolysin [Bacillus subtilis E1]
MRNLTKTSLLLAGLCTAAQMVFVTHASADQSIEYDHTYQTPSYIIEKSPQKPVQNTTQKESLFSYLDKHQTKFKLKGNANSHFRISKTIKDPKTKQTFFKLTEVYKGIPIYGFEQAVAMKENKQVKSFFGKVHPQIKDVSITPSISEKKAIHTARRELEASIGKIEYLDGEPKGELYIYPHDGEYDLAYLVRLSTSEPEPGYWHYFIDAKNGKVIESFNAIHEAAGTGIGVSGDEKSFDVTEQNGRFYLADETRGKGINTFDAKNLNETLFTLLSQLIGYTGKEIVSGTSVFNEPAAVDAHANAQAVYDYYSKTFGRDSFDQNGARITSTVHVGKQWNNAAWNGVQMVYGDGDGSKFKPLSGSLDIVAHEITHAVTQYSAGLLYQGEPGALNESISDIMGAMADRDDWEIGEDVYTPGIAGDSLRSLEDPSKQGNPDHYSNRYTGTEDYGGVHINSSIHNKAAYLLAEGGVHHGVQVEGIGREASEQIYYRALTYYVTASTDFSMMKQAAIEAANDLYGEGSKQSASVEKAYEAVGIL